MASSDSTIETAPAWCIPGIDTPISLDLPAEVAELREKALAFHQAVGPDPLWVPELTLAEARAWANQDQAEDWLIWRARRCAARLRDLPLDLEPGERIVGRPRLFPRTAEDDARIAQAGENLATLPAFPGGDAGHLHPDYARLFKVGLGGLQEEIARKGEQAERDARPFYKACRIALEGMQNWCLRVSQACQAMAAADGRDAVRWQALGSICQRVSHAPPRTFHEAIQLLFLTLVSLWFGEGHPLTSPGRLDQTLRPFYEADRAAGQITPQEAFELICCLYIQMNRILQTGSANSVIVGGRDRLGQDATNELTYLCLAARIAVGLAYPTVAVAWHEDTPSALCDFSMRMLAQGMGDPAFFNDALIVEGLREHGVTQEDAYDYMNSTCVEIKPVGSANIWVTQPYFNLPQSLLKIMSEVAVGDRDEPSDFGELSSAVEGELASQIQDAALRLDDTWRQRGAQGCFPLASCFIRDCLGRGCDFDRGGALYNWVENSFVGLANLVDSLVAVRYLVYDKRELSVGALYRILESDFSVHEGLRQRIINSLPKYGNDVPEPDALARQWAEFLIETSEANRVGPHRYVPGFFCWIKHEQLGAQTGATPDGRPARWPLADGAGGAQGRERMGPTASILSTTKWSHRSVLGGLVQNVKFSGDLLAKAEDRRALWDLIETYLRRGGFEIQVNIVSRETLLAAQEHPQQYADLLVRVAGYSDYFVKLNAGMQEEIIARTEHTL